MITRVSGADVLVGCRQPLGLPDKQDCLVDDILLTTLLRRSAGIHCPCSRRTLRESLLESLRYLSPDEQLLSKRIDQIIEDVMVGGDMLELNDVVIDDADVKGTWVFAAPPSFVVRPSGSIFLLGIVPDQDAFLPQALTSRISYENLIRVIVPTLDEDLPAELCEQGLQRLSEEVWLKSPGKEQPADMLSRFQNHLAKQPLSGTVRELRILDPAQPAHFYRGRWTTARNQTGTFIARRPQEFGAPIWCFAELEAGTVVRLLDLPLQKSRWGGCDEAWHLQMAIDHCSHRPQLYRRRDDGDGVCLDFFSPLPKWSQRRLMIIGRPILPDRSLMSFRLPATEAETEERFLQERLWLSCAEDAE